MHRSSPEKIAITFSVWEGYYIKFVFQLSETILQKQNQFHFIHIFFFWSLRSFRFINFYLGDFICNDHWWFQFLLVLCSASIVYRFHPCCTRYVVLYSIFFVYSLYFTLLVHHPLGCQFSTFYCYFSDEGEIKWVE